jgi:DNA-binding Xre family transcriptional regulator
VQKELDILKETVTKRIYILFMEKYKGNKLRFAKDVGCDEKTIRLIFDYNQGITLNLLFKIAVAIDIQPSELIKDLSLSPIDTINTQ